MSDFGQKLQTVAQTAARNGFALPQKLSEELSGLDDPHCSIAVVGKFQVGKSTLINRVFLRDMPILHEGEGLCTTAVPTEVTYGDSCRMRVLRRADDACGGETEVRAVDNPSREDLEAATVGNGPGERVKLSKELSRVQLTVPNEALRNYSIMDTPGIDDPEPDLLLNTTYRLLPAMNLAIVVVEPRALDAAEQDLLGKRLFSDGVSHLMVLVSYKPTGSTMQKDQRQKIVDTVKAQLESMGHGDIQVHMYCFDEAVADILNSVEEIDLVIHSFLGDNALKGREGRVAQHLRRFLEECLVEVATRSAAARNSTGENERLREAARKQKAKTMEKCRRLCDRLSRDFEHLRDKSNDYLRREIDRVFSNVANKVLANKTLSELQQNIEPVGRTLKLDLSDKLSMVFREVENGMREAMEKCDADYSDMDTEWHSYLEKDLEIQPGVMTKLPSLVYTVGDVFLLDLLMPGGFIIGLGGKLVQSMLPGIRNITLSNGVKSMAVKKITAQLNAAEEEYLKSAMEQIAGNIDHVLQAAKERLTAQYAEQADKIVSELEKTGSAADGSETARLEQVKKELEQAVNALK